MNPTEASEDGPLPQRKRPQPYKFTPEEIRVLRECSQESFYQRCVPFGTILGGATYVAIKTGSLSGHPKYGAIPKVAGAMLIGYFLGKYSYHTKCTEKFMALPNSKIGLMLRARRDGVSPDFDVPTGPLSPFSSLTDIYSDISEPNKNYDYDK